MSKTFKEGIEKGAEQVAQQIKETLPKVQFNKNGYEIRTQVLDMAKAFTEYEHSMKFGAWAQTVTRDPKTGEVVTTVSVPEVPGVDQVLETAEKFYNFVNSK